MSLTPDIICALATPRGEGAVGMVRASGAGALELLELVTRLRRPAPRRMIATELWDPDSDELLDQVMACAMPGPRSYTGEDVVELYGHGGTRNMERILELLLRQGARMAQPGEFTRRAFLNGRLDLAQAEAVAQVIAARSDRALRNAQAVLAGQLGRQLATLRDELLAITAQLEAQIDFADDLELDHQGAKEVRQLSRRHRQLEHQVQTLGRSYHQGRRLDGVVVALVGPVNAGKSSLFNRLLDSRRALVSEEPGTTRDYLEAETSWDGQRVLLVDTAGARPASQESALERAGQQLAAPVIERCDLLLLVHDLSSATPLQLPSQAEERPLVIAANKLDLCPPQALEQLELAGTTTENRAEPPLVGTSALRGDGIDELKQQLLRCLDHGQQQGDQPESLMISSQRHWEALTRTARVLAAAEQALLQGLAPELTVEHYREALETLGQITGESYTEQVLDELFASFCIGK